MEKIVYVYVKSEKIPLFVAKYKPISRIPSSFEGKEQVIYEEVYPEPSKRVIKLVEEVAKERGYEVNIIDISKEHPLKRLMDRHLSGVDKLPCVIGWKEQRLCGEEIKKEDLEAIMPYEFDGIFRAIVFLKVELGKSRDVRDRLLLLKEVVEAHVITGEWDILALITLRTKEGVSKNKIVIDFVENKISRIEHVLDTNTIIPEYGMTKLHVV